MAPSVNFCCTGVELAARSVELALAVREHLVELGLAADAVGQGLVVGVRALQPRDVALTLADQPAELGELARSLFVLLATVDQLLLTGGDVGRALVQLLLRLERVDDAGDVRQRAPVRHGLVDRRPLGRREAVLAVQYDGSGAARQLGDLLPEVVEHRRELAVRQLELVGQRALEGRHRGGHAAEDQDPDNEDGDGPARGAHAEPVEEGGHVSCSLSSVRRLRRSRRRAGRRRSGSPRADASQVGDLRIGVGGQLDDQPGHAGDDGPDGRGQRSDVHGSAVSPIRWCSPVSIVSMRRRRTPAGIDGSPARLRDPLERDACSKIGWSSRSASTAAIEVAQRLLRRAGHEDGERLLHHLSMEAVRTSSTREK